MTHLPSRCYVAFLPSSAKSKQRITPAPRWPGGAGRMPRRPGLSDALASLQHYSSVKATRFFPSARNTHRGNAGVGERIRALSNMWRPGGPYGRANLAEGFLLFPPAGTAVRQVALAAERAGRGATTSDGHGVAGASRWPSGATRAPAATYGRTAKARGRIAEIAVAWPRLLDGRIHVRLVLHGCALLKERAAATIFFRAGETSSHRLVLRPQSGFTHNCSEGITSSARRSRLLISASSGIRGEWIS
jgi:hypothetical protein